MEEEKTKFCKYCGEKIHFDAVLCTKCGRQVEELKNNKNDQIVINNNNQAVATANNLNLNSKNKEPKNKWIAIALCILLGYFGAHKFYEGKIGLGVIYLFTFGLFFIGPLIDFFTLLGKEETYYV